MWEVANTTSLPGSTCPRLKSIYALGTAYSPGWNILQSDRLTAIGVRTFPRSESSAPRALLPSPGTPYGYGDYGDDARMATNYLLVRLKHSSRVHFCRNLRPFDNDRRDSKNDRSLPLSRAELHSCRSLRLAVIANGIESSLLRFTPKPYRHLLKLNRLARPSERGPFSRASNSVRRSAV